MSWISSIFLLFLFLVFLLFLMLNEWYERVYLEGIIGKRMYNQYEKKSIKWIWHMTRNDGPCKKKETHDPTPIECKTRSLPLPSPPLPTKSSPTRNSCISSSGQELLYRTLGAVIKETLAWPTKKTCEIRQSHQAHQHQISNFPEHLIVICVILG